MNYYSNICKPTAKNLNKSVKLLKEGQLIGIPTETVYGLGSIAYNDKAVKKIYKLKKRPARNPIIVHFKDLKSIQSETMSNKYLKKYYQSEQFIKVLSPNKMISTNDVINTNLCKLSICKSKKNNKIIILSAIDNLIKGGSGQALQNFNIKFNFNEKLGLI